MSLQEVVHSGRIGEAAFTTHPSFRSAPANIHKNARFTPLRREEMALAVISGRLSQAQAARECIDPVKICSSYKGDGSDEFDDGRNDQSVDREA